MTHIQGGHTGISAAWASGYNKVVDDKTVVEIIGDGSLASSVGLGGMLNFANSRKKGLFILNDNKQGIGLNQFNYLDWQKIAEGMDFAYFEVKDGHDFEELQKAWDFFEAASKNVFVKVNTVKGMGLEEVNPEESEHYYVVSHKTSGKTDTVFALGVALEEVNAKIKADSNVCVVTAGMNYVFNLKELQKTNPDQVFDSGIAEEIAIVEAAALANANKEVYLIIFSSFFQRVYDQIVHDLIRNDLKVNIIVLSADVSSIGDSHHGIYDLNMINGFNNIAIYNPSTSGQIKSFFEVNNKETIRVMRIGDQIKADLSDKDTQTWVKLIEKPGNNKVILSYGNNIWALKQHIEENQLPVDLIDARKLNPIDVASVEAMLSGYDEVYLYERVFWKNNLLSTMVNELDFSTRKIKGFAFKNSVIGKGKIEELLVKNQMDYVTIFKEIL